jgi:endoglucanase Acf2
MATASNVGYGSIAVPIPRSAGSEGVTTTPTTMGSASSAFARYQRSGSGRSDGGNAEVADSNGNGGPGLARADTVIPSLTTVRPTPVRRAGSGLNNSGHGSVDGASSSNRGSRSGGESGGPSPVHASTSCVPNLCCGACESVTCNHSSSRFVMPLAPLLAFVVAAVGVFWWASGGPDLVLHHGQTYGPDTKGTGVGPKIVQQVNRSDDTGNSISIRVVGAKPAFKTVTRSSLDFAADTEALWTLLDASLFAPSSLLLDSKSQTPELAKPFPTGAFWTNLVINMKSANLPMSEAIVAEPYAFKWGPHVGLLASYPASRRTTSSKVVKDYFYPDLTLSCGEGVSRRQVIAYDTLSVHLRFYDTATSTSLSTSTPNSQRRTRSSDSSFASNENYFDAYIVQGSPYITFSYQHTTPKLTALSTFTSIDCLTDAASDHGLCETFVDTDSGMHGIRGVQFVIEAQEGLQWLVFSSEPLTFVLGDARRCLQAMEPFVGVLRLAMLPPGAKLRPKMGPAVLRLITHAPIYPVAGHVVTEYHLSSTTSPETGGSKKKKNSTMSGLASGGGDVAVVKFVFETKSWNLMGGSAGARGGSDLLLMMALTHHVSAMHETLLTPYGDSNPTVLTTLDKFDGTYLCIKGSMTAVVGDTWSYREPLAAVSLDYDRKISNPSTVNFIKGKTSRDVGYVIPTAKDIYGFGKEAARMAQLVHIAHALGDGMGDDAALSDALQTLGTSLDAFFRRSTAEEDSLLYDSDLGGVLSSFGLKDPQADFGNGRYSDHHFHYGYLLYASAILGRHNATFVAVHGEQVDALALDIANQDPTSSYYPVSRHKDFYGGHSWASGLFPQSNGKSQESSSEAVNAYYGASLWSLVSEDVTLHNFARLLLAMELRSAQTYW